MDLAIKANIDFLFQELKPTSNIPTKMSDPSKDRSRPKFLDKTLICFKTLSSRVVMGCTSLGPSWAISKWKVTYSHVQ